MKTFILMISASLLVSCGGGIYKPAAIGGDDQIIVFSDSANWSQCKESLQIVFERTTITPQPETDFYLQHEPISVFDNYKKYKYIIMIGTLDSKEPVSQTVRSMLKDEAVKAVESGEYFIFTRKDEWSVGQVIMVLTSNTVQDVNRFIQSNSDQLFEIFDIHKTKLMADFLYGTSAPLEDKALQKELYRKYHWSMRIHPDYKPVEEKPDSHYVRFHASSMYTSLQRWLSVYWVPLDSQAIPDSFLTKTWIVRTRNKIGTWFLDPVITTPSFDVFYRTDFGPYPAMVYKGIWKTVNRQDAFGGPFRSYTFYDEQARRIYFIDQAVFFPDEIKKIKFLRELDVISKTFTTKLPAQ